MVAAMAVDGDGRLWVFDRGLRRDGRRRGVRRRERACRTGQVIEHLHTPLGLLWQDGTLYVASKERVDTYSRFDGTRFAATAKILSLPPASARATGSSSARRPSPNGHLVTV